MHGIPWQYFQITAEKKKSEEEEKEKAAKDEAKDQEKEKEEKEGVPSSTESSATEQREAPISRVVADTTTQTTSPKSSNIEADSTYTEPEEDPIIAAAKRTQPGDSKIGTLEKIFSVLSIDRVLCLLGAILPQELSVSNGENVPLLHVKYNAAVNHAISFLSICSWLTGLIIRETLKYFSLKNCYPTSYSCLSK